MAETLSKAKNTSVAGMVEAGILASKGGKVRLLRPDELPADWDPDDRSAPDGMGDRCIISCARWRPVARTQRPSL